MRSRNKDGRFRKVRSDKGKPRTKKDQCPRCRHFTLEKAKGDLIDGNLRLWVCKRCNYKSIRKEGEVTDKEP